MNHKEWCKKCEHPYLSSCSHVEDCDACRASWKAAINECLDILPNWLTLEIVRAEIEALKEGK